MYQQLIHRKVIANDNATNNNNEDTADDTFGLINNYKIWMIITMILNILASLFCICSLILIIHYRKHPIIRMAQPGFLCIICFGALLLAISGFYLSLIETCKRWRDQTFLDVMCAMQLFTLNGGLLLVYVGLFGKLWRIKKVTRIRKGQPPVKEWHTKWPLFVVRILNLLIITVWLILEPPKWVIKENKNGTPIGYCYYEPKFLWPMFFLVIFSAVLGLFMAYKTRNVPDELSDGKYTYQIYFFHSGGYIVFGLLWGLGKRHGMPICILVGKILFCFFLSILSIAPLIVPKMYCIWYENKHDGNLPDGFEMSFGGGQVRVGGTHTAGITTPAAATATATEAAATATVATAAATAAANTATSSNTAATEAIIIDARTN